MPEEQVKKLSSAKTISGEKEERDGLDKFQKLPQPVQDFIVSPEGSETNLRIIEKFKLSLEQEDLFFDTVDRVVFKELSLGNFLIKIENKFKLDKEKSKELSLEILGNVFLPLDSYLGDVTSFIKKLGGDPNRFTVRHVALKKITPSELLKKIIVDTGIVLEDDSSKKRLKNIVVNRFKEIRDDEETIAALSRGKKVGGLELSEEIAKKIIQSIKASLGAFQLGEDVVGGKKESAPRVPVRKSPSPRAEGGVSGKGGGTESKKQTPPVVQPKQKSSVKAAKTKKPDIIYGSEEEREIEHHKKKMKEKKMVDEAINFNEELKKSTRNILEKGRLSFSDENLKQRLLKLISARLRVIRDRSETRELLLRDRSIGGLGLDEKNTERLLGLIEKEFELLAAVRKRGEFEKLEKWKKKKEGEMVKKEIREREEEKEGLEKRWNKLMDNSRPRKKKGQQTEGAAKKPLQPTGTSLPKTNLPKSPPQPVSVKTVVGKPRVEDIKFTPRLMGPIDELQRMTIADFRRLAQEPRGIIEKIKDKIELLEDESYTKKLRGVRAWQEAEPSRVYFEILNKSMTDLMSISDVLAEREAKKLPNLSQKEFSALMELNEELRV